MKNKLTRKLMLSAFTLLFAVISLGASTYAWFTMSNIATVDSFTGTVKGGEGVEIAITQVGGTPTQWYSGEISSKVIQDLIETTDFAKFDAITTQNAKEFYGLSNHVTSKDVDNDVYIEFDLHFKSAIEETLYLTELSFGSSESEKQAIDQAFTLSAKDEGKNAVPVTTANSVEFNVASAARIAFIQGEQDEQDEQVDIYQDEERSATNEYAGNSLDFDLTTGAFEYYNKKSYTYKEDENGEKQEVGNLIAPEGLEAPETSPVNEISMEKTTTIELDGETYSTVTVRVWIEGWDGECMNFIFNQILSVEMVFTLGDEETGNEETGDDENI